MSLIIGNGMCITYMETEITCPICDQVFDASAKMEKAKYPIFNTRCPKCKGKITISEPIFGEILKCWETECPKTVKRLKTITPNRCNGKIVSVNNIINYDDGEEDADMLV